MGGVFIVGSILLSVGLMGQLVEYVCDHDFLGLPVFRGAGGYR